MIKSGAEKLSENVVEGDEVVADPVSVDKLVLGGVAVEDVVTDGLEGNGKSPRERLYQLEGGSPRHSPTVTARRGP